jgi:hypothetical protein
LDDLDSAGFFVFHHSDKVLGPAILMDIGVVRKFQISESGDDDENIILMELLKTLINLPKFQL